MFTIPPARWNQTWRREYRTVAPIPGWPRPLVAHRQLVDDPAYRIQGPCPYFGARAILRITLAGSGIFQDGARTWRIGPGQGFLSPMDPGGHSFHIPPDARETWEWLHLLFDGGDGLVRPFLARHGPVFTLPERSVCRQRLLDLRSAGFVRSTLAAAEGARLVTGILADLAHDLAQGDLPSLVDEACRLLERRCTAPREAAITAVAAELGITSAHLCRRFRAVLGITPGDHLSACRLDRIRTLLCDPRLPLREIAQRVGFSSATHLVRFFRRQTGATPRPRIQRMIGPCAGLPPS